MVDPLSARRGRMLTEEFLQAALGQRDIQQAEEIFIECFGPANYSRAAGSFVDEFNPATGEHVRTWGPDGEIDGPRAEDLEVPGLRFGVREGDGPEVDPIRQEEIEALALCAFYWQTVVGMEAVQAFIAEGEGTTGSLKALALLQTRLGLSTSVNSRSRGMESLIQRQDDSAATTGTGNSFATVRLPADRRPPRNPLKRARSRR